MDTDREHSEQHTKQSRWGFRGMTFRDWLPIAGALLVSVVIALGSWAITWQLEKLENQRAETERELAEQRAQDEALQAYLDQMSQLILDRKLLEVEQGHPLHAPGDPVHSLAQARTSTAILRLDAEHNESVTHFLITSGLVVRSKDSARLLRGSTLSHAKLSGAHLPNADLGDADLSGADLSNALMVNANLIVADLSGADLSNALLDNADLVAHLPNADLSGASLIGADLSGADLSNALLLNANLIGADLSGADLSNALLDNADLVAHLPNADLSGASLIGADLSEANLIGANLSEANLIGANLSDAILVKANLSGAVLDSANLSGAEGITNEELEQQAASLEGAIMPNAQKYGNWLKDKVD